MGCWESIIPLSFLRHLEESSSSCETCVEIVSIRHLSQVHLDEMDQGTCLLFNEHGATQYFDSFRAVSRTPFSFDDYVRLTIGNTQVKWGIKSFSTKSLTAELILHWQLEAQTYIVDRLQPKDNRP